MSKMQYRPEIDGIRAIAVLSVVVFHSGLGLLKGGFLGVDLFFVISGFLITRILINDLESGNFSIITFYERRIRRILPALFVTLALSFMAAWYLMSPIHMEGFSRSLVAVATFCSNILFWQESGYFDTAAELRPLLHTWSLAVEEQFYIFFPLFLMIAWRFGKKATLSLLALAFVVSLAIAHWGVMNKPVAAFYLMPTRAWELLVGVFAAFMAQHMEKRQISQPLLMRNLLSGIGLVAVVGSILFFDPQTAIPSFPALVPTIGTALLILFATKGTLVNRLLRIRILVVIGLISYSAYLFHQPLLAFARYRSLHELSSAVSVFLCVSTFVWAYLSWRYIEQPFRNRKVVVRRAVFPLGAAATAMLIVSGVWNIRNDGVNANNDTTIASASIYDACHFHHQATNLSMDYCRASLDFNKYYVLVGDSHAMAFFVELKKTLAHEGYGLIAFTKNTLYPIAGTYREGMPDSESRMAFLDSAYDFAMHDPHVEGVYVAARWASHIEGGAFKRPDGLMDDHPFSHTRIAGSSETGLTSQPDLLAYSAQFLAKVANYRPVTLFGPVPEVGVDVPRALLLDRSVLNYPVSWYDDREKNALELLRMARNESPNISIVDVRNVFCRNDAGVCIQEQNGHSLYVDDDHVSLTGAKLVMHEISKQLDKNHTLSQADPDQTMTVGAKAQGS
ncbi:acyltransferase family protein [uncultured Cohaesibacter sp.]|uniref:acyltransferase family protein n=1 Tax=uncultured Cohaesibacter sp. TaxID=1002546 RepID=UPI002AAA7A85|nr:acyltransferase family protein [uncultured Cohaesibacter sp.]